MIKSRVFRRRFPLSRKSHVTPPRRWEPETKLVGHVVYELYGRRHYLVAGGKNWSLSELERLGARDCRRWTDPERSWSNMMSCTLPRRPARLSRKLRAALGWTDDLRGGRE
jgi:hypothetical protein